MLPYLCFPYFIYLYSKESGKLEIENIIYQIDIYIISEMKLMVNEESEKWLRAIHEDLRDLKEARFLSSIDTLFSVIGSLAIIILAVLTNWFVLGGEQFSLIGKVIMVCIVVGLAIPLILSIRGVIENKLVLRVISWSVLSLLVSISCVFIAFAIYVLHISASLPSIVDGIISFVFGFSAGTIPVFVQRKTMEALISTFHKHVSSRSEELTGFILRCKTLKGFFMLSILPGICTIVLFVLTFTYG